MITQPASVRRAVVLTLWLFDPASGSVSANAIFRVPSARPGSQLAFISADACAARIEPQMAGEMTAISNGIPCAASSSVMMTSSLSPAPPPPYSAGRCTPSSPAWPSSAHSSAMFPPARARSA